MVKHNPSLQTEIERESERERHGRHTMQICHGHFQLLGCNGGNPCSLSSSLWCDLCSAAPAGAVSHMHSQRATLVQMPQLQKLLRHGVEASERQDVVVVVVADEVIPQAQRKGPEAVDGDFLAQPQRQADQEEACGEALGTHATPLPELAHALQEVWVGEEHRLVGAAVGEGVVGPQRGVRARLHREGRHVDVARAIGLHALHERLPRPQQVLESGSHIPETLHFISKKAFRHSTHLQQPYIFS